MWQLSSRNSVNLKFDQHLRKFMRSIPFHSGQIHFQCLTNGSKPPRFWRKNPIRWSRHNIDPTMHNLNASIRVEIMRRFPCWFVSEAISREIAMREREQHFRKRTPNQSSERMHERVIGYLEFVITNLWSNRRNLGNFQQRRAQFEPLTNSWRLQVWTRRERFDTFCENALN
jgi:hypothetical protein